MKKNPQLIITILLFVAALAWMGRGKIKQLFPPKMKFANTQLLNIDTQSTTSIDALKGQVLIVSYYQTWCGDCARETPVLNQLAANLNSDHLKIVYVSQEPIAKVAAFRSRFASDKIWFTQTNETPDQLGISSFPTTFLIDKTGSVVLTKLEGYDWLSEEQRIRKMLSE